MQRKHSAFTLVELLTVLAITAVLLTLIVYPVIQTFNLVRTGQGFADAQDKARQLIERISREMNNAAAIRDNAGMRGALNVVVPGENGADVTVPLQYVKLDLVKPAEGDPSLRDPITGAYYNPNINRYDPTINSPKGQVVLPVTPGNTIVRYFIGLRDPFSPYMNPYDGLLMPRVGGRDNLFVLYRVEVSPYRPDGTVNAQFFFDLSRDNDPNTHGPWFDDPDFWNPNIPLPAYATSLPGDATKQQIIQNWLSRATVMTEVSRYDMILPLFDRQTRRVVYDANVPRLVPLIQFRPSSVGSEPTAGQSAVRLSDENDAMSNYAPDVFRSKFGSWSTLLARFWPDGYNPTGTGSYVVGHYDQSVPDPNQRPFGVFIFDPTVHSNESTDGIPIFNSDGYLRDLRNRVPYPFTRNELSSTLTAVQRTLFMPFAAVFGEGKVVTSFGIDEVGDDPGRLDKNPTVATGDAYSPVNDPDTTGNWYDAHYSPSNAAYRINRSFNKIWREQLNSGGPIAFGLLPDVHRFIDLRVVRFSDGTFSPLHPDPAIGFARAHIVPGSEIVIGPDANPGPNYGQPVRYSRVAKNPGPNQYRINYTDLPEPTNPQSGLPDYSLIGLPNPPATYTPTDFVSSIIQPRYKAGYVQFNSDPNVPLPSGNISIFYRFQFNRARDTLSLDYDSRQLMSVLLTIRNYPQSTVPNPQTVTLKGTATIRNVLR